MSARAAPPGRRRARGPRGILLALLLLGLLLAAALPGAGAAPVPSGVGPAGSGPGWTTFHGSENRSGFTPESGPATGNRLVDIDATGQPIRAGPVVAGGVVYAADDFGTIFAVNLSENATVLWRASLGTTPTTPDLAGTLLVVGGSDGFVSAFSSANGSRVWAHRLDGRVTQAVGVANGSVLAATSNGSLYALRLADGALEWSLPLGAPVDGGVAIEGGDILVATATGNLSAIGLDGTRVWNASVGAGVDTAPAVFGGRVVVGDLSGNVSSFALGNGSRAWGFVGRDLAPADAIEATPAVDGSGVYVSTDLGEIYALDPATGALLWRHATGSAGYPTLSSPALTPTGLYVSDAVQELIDLNPANGSLLWRSSFAFTPSYASPAVAGGLLVTGDDLGGLYAYGAPGGPPRYPVSGTVVNATGAPLPATITTVGAEGFAAADGSFSLALPNGSFVLTVSAPGYLPADVPVTVAGAPVRLPPIVLGPVPTVPVSGRVVDLYSAVGLGNATVTLHGEFGYVDATRTAADGSFALVAPAGLDYLTVSPPAGYRGLQVQLSVGPNGTAGVVLPLEATGLGALGQQHPWDAVAPFLAFAAAAAVVAAWHATRRRLAAGLSPRLLSRFGRYFVMRALLIVVQILGGLFVLFVFGSVLPAVAFGARPCVFFPAGGCLASSASWANPLAAGEAILDGFGSFVWNLFTLNWGTVSFGFLREPATTFLAWWFPDSLELALFALPIAAGLAYVIGLRSGARPDGPVDVGARLASVGGLLLPSFLIVLLFLGTFYEGFFRTFGDTPYGLLPTPQWFVLHGGPPRWIGLGSNTSPTGLPLVDGAIHGDWPFVELVLLKTLWQALAIAIVYVAIFLRFVRHAVVEAHAERHVVADRARGISEPTILWRHTGRRVIPLFLLVFGMTLPIYIGTQSLVEALANDSGVGTLLIAEMTRVSGIGFGYSGINPTQHIGSFYQVTIFLLFALVLIGNLCADLLAHYLDPRLDREGPR